MRARIFQPAKTAMQSGKAKTTNWQLEFDAETARRVDPLMGWTSGTDMTANQVRLSFESKDEAVAYAEQHKIPYQVIERAAAPRQSKSYSENFSYQRRKPWTH